MTLGYRLRRLWRAWKRRCAPMPKPARDVEAEEIARIEAQIGRLVIAAMIGSLTAAGQLAGMAEDRVGMARRRMAHEALRRLQSSAVVDARRSHSAYQRRNSWPPSNVSVSALSV